ncbi:hypothetical protein [Cellulosimicrobium sp. Marseille-Q4280]|uniref:hypothetical protein n=1 Tax=Cellulosimicrobium sp. Marseille-Q4280 TaxID=2937992 RepID=UPI0020407C79|nr:hypothetical protein [Cellulosimicrobium sp. Marseille-Q4280]
MTGALRGRRGAAVLVVLTACLSACGPAVRGPDDGAPDEAWTIGVAHGEGDWMSCVEASGLSVAEMISTADMPASSVGVRFDPGVSRSEASDVVRCIEDRLTAGEVSLELSPPLARPGVG